VQVNIRASQHVRKGQVLVRLDDSTLLARFHQAEAAYADANQLLRQAETELAAIRQAYKTNAATDIEFTRAQTAERSAAEGLARARAQLNEAKVALDQATIVSPMDGLVVDKRVDAGDTASPGQVLLSLYDPARMQLVATVRESLARRLRVGQQLDFHIDALNMTGRGEINEVVPQAEAASRTFQVKVNIPSPKDTYPGMFGRLSIFLGQRDATVIPQGAVLRVGQLEMVHVVQGGVWHRRAVRLGRRIGQDVEVLSGLRPGEVVAVPQPTTGPCPATAPATQPTGGPTP